MDHLTSNDSIKSQSELQPQAEPEVVECLSSPEDNPVIAATSDNEQKNNCSTTKATKSHANKPVSWDNLPPFLQPVIPSDEEYSYIIEDCNELPVKEFSGAGIRFTATLRINLNNGKEAKDWVDKMCDQSKCTYRITRTYRPSLKRILWRTDMHCQHQRKPLSTKQLAAKALSKKKRSSLMGSYAKRRQHVHHPLF